MSAIALYAEKVLRKPPEAGDHSSRNAMLDELCSTLFAALPRSDQRRTGTEYIQGLLSTDGRKSIRNIAGRLGGQATEQRLHHFICSSTWDWRTVRQALGRYVTSDGPPQAWVVRPMVIPKAGENSVGVDRRFFPAFGQVLNGQEACGVWAAWDDRSIPINWRLHLSGAWLDNDRRERASIPDSVVAEPLGHCGVESYLGMMRDWDLPVRPVVLDGRGTNVIATIRRFVAASVPVLIRFSGTCPLSVAPTAVPGRSGDIPADRIMAAVRNVGSTVFWRDHTPAATMHTSTVSTMRVRIPTRTGGGQSTRHQELLLMGVRENGQRWPTEFWLTTMVDARLAELMRLSRLTQRVDLDFDAISDRVGIRDFTGRSFDGWHRHVTLASAAHAIALTTRGTNPWPGGDRSADDDVRETAGPAPARSVWRQAAAAGGARRVAGPRMSHPWFPEVLRGLRPVDIQ
jgi:SRSO17 transposase